MGVSDCEVQKKVKDLLELESWVVVSPAHSMWVLRTCLILF